MSNISTFHDALLTRLQTVFPNHMRLPNPYAIDQNPQGHMIKGYGIKFGSANNSNADLCSINPEREIIVVLTREYLATDADPASKATAEKNLYEDQLLLIKDAYSESTYSGSVYKFYWESDSGVLFQFEDERQFLYLETSFTCQYRETIT